MYCMYRVRVWILHHALWRVVIVRSPGGLQQFLEELGRFDQSAEGNGEPRDTWRTDVDGRLSSRVEARSISFNDRIRSVVGRSAAHRKYIMPTELLSY